MIHLALVRLVLAVVGMYNLIQLLEARAPLQRNVSVQHLLPGLDVAGGVYLEPVLVKETLHVSVGSALLAGIVERRTATPHAPRLLHVGRITKKARGEEKESAMTGYDILKPPMTTTSMRCRSLRHPLMHSTSMCFAHSRAR